MESFILFLILLLTVQSAQEKSYFRLNGKYDHSQARIQCKKHGGILATFRNKQDHQKAVEKCFEGVSRPNWRDDDCRIGLHFVNHRFAWLDTNTHFSYNQIKNPYYIAHHKIWSPCFNLEGHYGRWNGGVVETTTCNGPKKVLCEKTGHDCVTGNSWDSCRTCVRPLERKAPNHCSTCHHGCQLRGTRCFCGKKL